MKLNEGRYFTDEELSNLTDHSKTIVDCSLNGNACEFEIFFTYKYFNCYRLKNNMMRESRFEFTTVLFSGQPVRVSPQRGFYLFIENSKSYPLLSTPILLSTGYGRHIKVNKNSYNQYPTPYSDCQVLEDNTLTEDILDRSIFDMVLATNYSYTRDVCLIICNQLVNKESCGCQAYDNYILSGIEFCTEYFDSPCKQNISAFDYCMPRCPLECSRPAYRKQISTFTYPPSYLEKYESFVKLTDFFVDNHISDRTMTKFMYDTLVEFSITYDSSLDAEYSEDPKMTGEDLLGILGGHFHLFLGMSLMSFFEIIELIVVILFNV